MAHTTPATAQAIEAILLPEAAQLSVRRLRDRALALLLELDADAIDTTRKSAQRQADVRSCPSHLEGMATLAAELPADEATEGFDLIDQLAQVAKADGDTRPIGQIGAEIFSLLIRRPGYHGLPGVTARVTVTAALDALEGTSATPGSVNGLPITAADVRDLLARLGALGPAGARGRVAAGPPRLPGTPGQRLPLLGPGPPITDHRLHAHRRPARLRHHPRPHLSVPQLRAARRPRRPRPRHPARPRRAHRLRQPVLPVPQPPPAQDPRPRLAVRHGPRRHAAGHHPVGGHPHHPTTRPATTGATRATRATGGSQNPATGGTAGRRSATVLTPHEDASRLGSMPPNRHAPSP